MRENKGSRVLFLYAMTSLKKSKTKFDTKVPFQKRKLRRYSELDCATNIISFSN